MAKWRDQPYFFYSIILHTAILLVLILGVDFSSPAYVFENTNQQNVISAVVLGDSPKSHILPKQILTEPKQGLIKPKPKPESKSVASKPAPVKDAIALKKPIDKKKLAEKKLLEALKKKNIFGHDLLTDIKKQKVTQKNEKKLAQEKLEANLKKTLQKQSEESMRQQLLNEDIKLKSIQSKQAQGIVNKYIALVKQAIEEHWIIPVGTNKKSSCELMIRLAPGGFVLDVQVTKSSGNPALDSSARAAVLKASPLPVPKEADAFAAFKLFVLKVKPENVIG